ncbi:hypothetical protein CC1G_15095 [Coprinopsis cinerea okayama7|uniref:Uncharacterized protein n=1 Tax=Coprinopsis cinerea (strain Okayama-7 / 130 / ATCC MYA-4618 / FGSC 9003) TaxID=240176 RepID=D6RPG2_COPC7|nr:hypothetical protein CC1G_15095 [Coprinopsis cinerea okayama7\|eukprot:XP_002910761.1 hypothetical protein CC1G_15095 [Coprinopsis cinerea okayama7\
MNAWVWRDTRSGTFRSADFRRNGGLGGRENEKNLKIGMQKPRAAVRGKNSREEVSIIRTHAHMYVWGLVRANVPPSRIHECVSEFSGHGEGKAMIWKIVAILKRMKRGMIAIEWAI